MSLKPGIVLDFLNILDKSRIWRFYGIVLKLLYGDNYLIVVLRVQREEHYMAYRTLAKGQISVVASRADLITQRFR